ncbi:MAG: fibronectin type III domain-containing protein [Lachnospiraceae bacterium]|nr:fibronectin type III domain-containing protein [Lachnospiraceae bacterium]
MRAWIINKFSVCVMVVILTVSVITGSMSVMAAEQTATEVPGAPVNLKVKKLAEDDDHYLLTWDTPATGGKVEYYIIQSYAMYTEDEGYLWRDFDQFQYYPCNVYPKSLATNVIRLVAVNSAGRSEPSNTVVLDDLVGVTPEYLPIAIKPKAVAGDSVVTLEWKPDTTSNWAKPEYYEIFRMAPDDNDFRTIGYVLYEEGKSGYRWVDDTVENEQLYLYRVRACNYLGCDYRLETVGYLEATPSATNPSVSGNDSWMEENTLDVLGKTITVKYSSLKKKAQTVKVSKAIRFYNKGQGTISYKKKSGNKKILIDKKIGKLTIKKDLKKGTYKVKITVMAAGDEGHKSTTMTTTVKIKVK